MFTALYVVNLFGSRRANLTIRRLLWMLDRSRRTEKQREQSQ
jgi:hypothetical protein